MLDRAVAIVGPGSTVLRGDPLRTIRLDPGVRSARSARGEVATRAFLWHVFGSSNIEAGRQRLLEQWGDRARRLKIMSCVRRCFGLLRVAALSVWFGVEPAPAASQAPAPLVVADFDEQALSKFLAAQGQVRVERLAIPAPAASEGSIPAGQAARISASPRGIVYTIEGVVPSDLRRFSVLEFWVYRDPEEAQRVPASVIDVQFANGGAFSAFSRRVDVTHSGWDKIALPLAWFRTIGGRVPRWDRIVRLQFHFRDNANIWLDTIALIPGQDEHACEISERDLRELAFPNDTDDAVFARTTNHVRILTNEPALELDKLAEHLEKVSDAFYRDLPFLEKPAASPFLIVFRTRDEYRAFPPRFAAKLSGVAGPPESGGFTIQGIATSSFDPAQGTLRPVYTHEVIHALLERAAHMPNKGEWFQEGMANYYQLQFHPQANWAQIISGGLQNANQRSPLPDLLKGEPIGGDRYWQAATVAGMLISEEPFKPRSGDLLNAFQEAGSTNLEPQLASVLKTDWRRFEAAWRAYCQKLVSRNR